jgi:hypothetical protein
MRACTHVIRLAISHAESVTDICSLATLASCGFLEHFPEKHALAKAGVDPGFPSENATTQEEVERFPIQSESALIACLGDPLGPSDQLG